MPLRFHQWASPGRDGLNRSRPHLPAQLLAVTAVTAIPALPFPRFPLRSGDSRSTCPQLWTLILRPVTHHHVDNSPTEAIVVNIQTPGSQSGPSRIVRPDLGPGPEPMTESWSLVIFTDRRRPSLTLPPASPHGPLNLAFSTPRSSSEIGETTPASATLHT